MTTDLVPVEPRRPGWVDVMGPAHELAVKLHETEFVPGRLRKRPAAVMACILSGDEAGIGPMQSLRQIFVTDDGKVGMAAELMRSLVLREGHEIWAEDYTNTRVTMAGRRKGQENPSRVTWTLDDAKKAGLAHRQNWTKYPRAMLSARATTELCRLLFADVIAGISYSMEELEDDDVVSAHNGETSDGTSAPPTTAKRKAPAPRRSRAKPETPASPGPPLPTEEEAPAPATGGMPIAQKIAMRAREAGVDHHEVVAAVTSGTKRSAMDCDATEAAAVLEAVGQLARGELRLVTPEGASWPSLQETEDGIEDAEVVEDEGPPLPGEETVPTNPDDWGTAQWKAFLAARGARYGDAMREAQRLAKEDGADPPSTLDGIGKIPGLAARVRDYIESMA